MDEQNKDSRKKKAQPSAELSDQELDQVAGGTKWQLSELDAAKHIKSDDDIMDYKVESTAKTGRLKV